jgi:hypothetical protein
VSSNEAGQAYALTVLTPIAPGRVEELRQYLEQLPQDASPLAKLEGTHFARWVIVPDFAPEPKQPKEDHLTGPFLLFTSNFDGPLDGYLDELCLKLAAEASEIWGRCIGCPEPAAGAELKAYLLHNQIDTGFFVAAYPDATVGDVKRSLQTRDQVIRFATGAQGLDPPSLRSAFIEEFPS